MAKIEMYTTEYCPYCDRAKQLLKLKKAEFEEIRIDLDPAQRDIMMERSGKRTVPQIFINDQAIGGFDDLWNLERAGKLDALLA